MSTKLSIKGIILNNESLWESITLDSSEVQQGIELGTLQESESLKLGLKDRSFDGTKEDSLKRSIAAKQFEIAIKKWGGNTAQVIGINQFHDFPDVGKCNARFTFDSGYGLMITNRDQGLVPMILGTGNCPNFKLMGWCVPDFMKQMIYKIHQGRTEDCQTAFGFLQEMKEHEAFHLPMQVLMPMYLLNKDLLK
jgi:hypothetical protein